MVKNKNRHICVIVSCLLAVMVAIMPLLSLSDNKTTAKADSITSDEPLVLLPSFYFYYHDVEYVMPTFFLSFGDNSFGIYSVYSNNSLNGHYVSRSGFSYGVLTHCNDLFFLRSDFAESPNTRYINLGYDCYCLVKGDVANLSRSVQVYITSEYNSSINGRMICYNFVFAGSSSGDVVFSIGNFDDTFEDINFDTLLFNYTTIACPVDISGLDQYIIDSAYQRGYNDAYQIGYNKGINEQFSDIQPWQYIVSGVNEFLSIKLFGDVSLSIVLSVAFGCILLGFAIKIFLGG